MSTPPKNSSKKNVKEPTYVKLRDVFKNKKNPKNPSLVENKDEYADTKKPFPDYKKSSLAANSISLAELERKIKENNEKYGTDFSIGQAYGQYELWACGNRLEAGSKKDVYEAWIKNRFKDSCKKKSSLIKEGSMRSSLAYLAGKNVAPKTAGIFQDKMQQVNTQVQKVVGQIKSAFAKFRSLVFEVPSTGQVIEAAQAGNKVDLKVFRDKSSPTPSTEKSFDLNTFVDFFLKKIAPQDSEKVVSELMQKGISSIAKPVFAKVATIISRTADISKKKINS